MVYFFSMTFQSSTLTQYIFQYWWFWKHSLKLGLSETVLVYVSHVWSLQLHGLQLTRLLCPWNSSCKNTGVDCHCLLRVSSQPRDRTLVSCIAGRFFTVWATREACSGDEFILIHTFIVNAYSSILHNHSLLNVACEVKGYKNPIC